MAVRTILSARFFPPSVDNCPSLPFAGLCLCCEIPSRRAPRAMLCLGRRPWSQLPTRRSCCGRPTPPPGATTAPPASSPALSYLEASPFTHFSHAQNVRASPILLSPHVPPTSPGVWSPRCGPRVSSGHGPALHDPRRELSLDLLPQGLVAHHPPRAPSSGSSGNSEEALVLLHVKPRVPASLPGCAKGRPRAKRKSSGSAPGLCGGQTRPGFPDPR